MRHLRVCWQNPDNAYNCGRCEKCFRTMLDLWVVGALDRCDTLPHQFDEQALALLKIPAHLVSFWQAAIDRATARDMDPDVIRRLSNTVAQSQFEVGAGGRVLNRAIRTVSTFGLDPARLKAIDARWSRGIGLRILRRLQGSAPAGGSSA